MASFSERMGYIKPKLPQLEDLDKDTRITLFNAIERRVFDRHSWDCDPQDTADLKKRVSRAVWCDFFKKPAINPPGIDLMFSDLLLFFAAQQFYRVFDLIEFIIKIFAYDPYEKTWLIDEINAVLESEFSGFRCIRLTTLDSTYHKINILSSKLILPL